MAESGIASQRKASRDDEEDVLHTLSIQSSDKKKENSPSLLKRWILCTTPAHWACFGFVVGMLMILLFWNVRRSVPPSLDLRQLTAIKSAALDRTQVRLGSPGYPVGQGGMFSDTNDYATLMKERAVDNRIILTISTSSYQALALNLICSLEKLGVTNYIVGALELSVFQKMKSLGYPVFAAFEDSVLGGDEVQSAWDRREGFHRVNVVKEEVLAWALEEGYEVILTDADTVWRKLPFDDLTATCQGYDYCFQTAIVNQAGDSELNGGFINIKPTTPAVIAQKMLVVILSENIYLGDQQEIRKMLCGESKRTSNITCEDPISGAKTKLLPLKQYAKSAMLFNISSPKTVLESNDPFIMHYNSGLPEKKQKVMANQGMWHLDANNKCV